MHDADDTIIYVDFNPRSREGSDCGGLAHGLDEKQFQSTLPRGERPMRIVDLVSPIDFNPRSREGSDDCSCI